MVRAKHTSDYPSYSNKEVMDVLLFVSTYKGQLSRPDSMSTVSGKTGAIQVVNGSYLV
jgi:hypothetical protein